MLCFLLHILQSFHPSFPDLSHELTLSSLLPCEPSLFYYKTGVFLTFSIPPSFFPNVLPPTGECASIKPVSVAHEYANVFVWEKKNITVY